MRRGVGVVRLVVWISAAVFAGTGVSPGQSPLESGKAGPMQEGAQAPAKGGAVTGGVFPPVYNSDKRPTVGGTVKAGEVMFQDCAKQAGLTRMPW